MSAFTIYEKHPTADAYRVGGFYSPYALVSSDKRFTDSELAAETWRAEADWRNAYRSAPMPGIGQWAANQFAAHDRERTLYRLATLPHAHETDYQ